MSTGEGLQARLEKFNDSLLEKKDRFDKKLGEYLDKCLKESHLIFKDLEQFLYNMFTLYRDKYWEQVLPIAIKIKIPIQEFIDRAIDEEVYDNDDIAETGITLLGESKTLYKLYNEAVEFESFKVKDFIYYDSYKKELILNLRLEMK